MKFFAKRTIVKILLICICVICVFSLIPVKVNAFGPISVLVIDFDGSRLANRSIIRSFEYGLYAPDKMFEDKKVTDENGSVTFPQADFRTFLGVYVFKNVLYQLTDPCPCCLQQLYVTIERAGGEKEVFYKSMNGNSYTFTKIKIISNLDEFSIDKIDQDKFNGDVSRILAMGYQPWVHPDLLGEIRYLSPKHVSVNFGIIHIESKSKKKYLCILSKEYFSKKYNGGRYLPTPVQGLYEEDESRE